MKLSITRYLKLIILLGVSACGGGSSSNGIAPGVPDTLTVEEVANGLVEPLYLTAPPSDPRLFIVEKGGRIRIVKNGQLLVTPFLDISKLVSNGNEQGLLGLAFHPDYATNRFFYVNYTDRTTPNSFTRVARYRAISANSDIADANSAQTILSVEQPFSNHNGGFITFGDDGMLYIALGDGGSGGDPQGNGQNRGTLLGSLLRIDVNGSSPGNPYTIPPGNPFEEGNINGDRAEIWAYGLRNPWRLSFDRQAGLIFIGDVGQNSWEEVSVSPSTTGGLNYGWNIMEGTNCFASNPCNMNGLIIPVLEYANGQNCSITGGYVYRGSLIPGIQGHYFYSDFCSGFLRSFVYANGMATDQRVWTVGNLGSVASFGEDASGELYILSFNGNVYRLVAP